MIKKRKVIACDIDGCLNLMIEQLVDVAKREYKADVSSDLTDYEILEKIGYKTPDEFNQFWKKHGNEIENKCQPFPGSVDILKKLKNDGFEIILITARGYDIASLTESNLKKHGFIFDEILFNTGTKIDACKWKDIPIMIEDNGKNAMILSDNNVKVLMPVHGYNKYINGKNIVQCKTWNDIYNGVKNFYNN